MEDLNKKEIYSERSSFAHLTEAQPWNINIFYYICPNEQTGYLKFEPRSAGIMTIRGHSPIGAH